MRRQPLLQVLLLACAIAAVGCSSTGSTDTTADSATGVTSTEVQADPAEPPPEGWDLLWISNSTGFGAAELLADRLEADLGVDVHVTDHAVGGQQAMGILSHLNGEASTDWSDDIRRAEMIVIHGGTGDSGVKDGIEDCKLPSIAETSDPEVFTVQDLRPFDEVMHAIYDHIWQLRRNEPVVLRSYDIYNYPLADWRRLGTEDVCTGNFEAFSTVMASTAAQNAGINASVLDSFGGINHDEDPREKGLIDADGVHPSPKGTALIVDTIASLGYETSMP
ncbi:MAG: SGNH/GDSL hydrolase family protein [Acidimicrobiia bacterium]